MMVSKIALMLSISFLANSMFVSEELNQKISSKDIERLVNISSNLSNQSIKLIEEKCSYHIVCKPIGVHVEFSPEKISEGEYIFRSYMAFYTPWNQPVEMYTGIEKYFYAGNWLVPKKLTEDLKYQYMHNEGKIYISIVGGIEYDEAIDILDRFYSYDYDVKFGPDCFFKDKEIIEKSINKDLYSDIYKIQVKEKGSKKYLYFYGESWQRNSYFEYNFYLIGNKMILECYSNYVI